MIKTIVKILSRQPLWMHYVWADILIYPLMYHVVRYRRKLVLKNMTLCFPEKSEKEIQALCKRFYHCFADHIVEIIWGYMAPKEEVTARFTFDQEGEKQVIADLLEHGGIMGMLAHMGNWEWTAEWHNHIAPHGGMEYNIYRQLKNKTMDELMLDIRRRRGGDCIEKDLLLRKMVSLRKSGTPITYGMLSDQKPSPQNAHFWTEFLHRETSFLDGSEVLGQKFGYPCYFVYTTSPSRGHYHARLIKLDGKGFEGQDYPITRQYAALLEQNIREQPEQWLWTHNRWKWSRPQ